MCANKKNSQINFNFIDKKKKKKYIEIIPRRSYFTILPILNQCNMFVSSE